MEEKEYEVLRPFDSPQTGHREAGDTVRLPASVGLAWSSGPDPLIRVKNANTQPAAADEEA